MAQTPDAASSGGVLDSHHLVGVEAPLSAEELSLIGLMQLDLEVSTATRMVEQSVEAAPSIVHVISRDEIDRFGYRDIAEALQNTPGLFIVDDLVTSNVAVRGIFAGHGSWSRTLKFMVNGRPVQSHSTGGAMVGPEYIPMLSVERIEVVRGPASSVYGANAFLGVVNVITRQPSDAGGALLAPEVGFVGGRPGFRMGAAVWGESEHRQPVWAHLSVDASVVDRSQISVPESSPSSRFEGQESERDVSRPAVFLGRAGWDGGTDGKVELQTVYQRTDTSASFGGIGMLNPENRIARANWALRADYYRPLFDGEDAADGDSLEFHTWGGVTLGETLEDERFITPSGTIQRRRSNLTTDVGGEFAYESEGVSVVLGMDFRGTKDEGDTLLGESPRGDLTARNVPKEIEFDNLGAFGQLLYSPWRPLSLISSVRLDHNDQWGDNATYRVGSVVRAAPWLTLKALLGTAFVPPAPTELGAVPLSLRGGVVGNPELSSQHARTGEVALLVRPRRDLWLDVTGYWTKIESRVEVVPVGQLFRAENQTASESFGVEGLVKWSLGHWLLQADASIQTTAVQEPELPYYRWTLSFADEAVWGNHPANYPRYMLGQKVAYSLTDWHVELALSGRLVGERKSTVDNAAIRGESYLLKEYYLLDAHLRTVDLEVLPGRASVFSLHVKNLLAQEYSHGGVGGLDIPGLGRSVYLRYSQGF